MRNNRESVKGKKTAAARKVSKPKSRDPSSFVEAITGESWTTPSVFEDLCLLMLSELLERPFRRARAGFQEGRDLDSDLGSIVTHVECKRYSGKLKDREIVGELAQSIVKTPSLEVYVLCATTAVHAQLAAQMRQVAAPHLIEVVFLDCKEPVSSLALCFAATQSWRNVEGAAWGRLKKITQELDELKAHPSAEDSLVNIYDSLSGIIVR